MLECLICLHSYTDMFLPDALRKFFSLIPAPLERGHFLENLLERFSVRYLECNPKFSLPKGDFVVVFALRLSSENVVDWE